MLHTATFVYDGIDNWICDMFCCCFRFGLADVVLLCFAVAAAYSFCVWYAERNADTNSMSHVPLRYVSLFLLYLLAPNGVQ